MVLVAFSSITNTSVTLRIIFQNRPGTFKNVFCKQRRGMKITGTALRTIVGQMVFPGMRRLFIISHTMHTGASKHHSEKPIIPSRCSINIYKTSTHLYDHFTRMTCDTTGLPEDYLQTADGEGDPRSSNWGSRFTLWISMDILTGLRLQSLLCTLLWDRTRRVSLHSPNASMSLGYATCCQSQVGLVKWSYRCCPSLEHYCNLQHSKILTREEPTG
ncbi:uncharacterized protein LOC142662411 isoform X2 [Rhinoderma darwinii]|uniref:uncharacterized protein LOC142662411 isoform X2 n=1 Tax=Rhinoderma darwinii TaxID=43563 RepID=UPI003F6820B6